MIRITLSEITLLPVEAIVNFANERMPGYGGEDGAIHRASGRVARDQWIGGGRKQRGLCPRLPGAGRGQRRGVRRPQRFSR